MLVNLTVRDIVLIDRADMEFGAGLSVLTGETGAGKSILLDSLALVLGARGDAGLVRAGAERGEIRAVFEIEDTHPVWALLSDSGLEPDNPLVLRRTQYADGKSRAHINDSPCSIGLLKSIGSALVEIHGQHDERAMLDAETHRKLLDAYGALEPDHDAVALRCASLRDSQTALGELTDQIEQAERQGDYLKAALEELELLGPEVGEDERLAERRQILMQAAKIATDLNHALDGLAGEASPISHLAGVLRILERKSADVPGLLDGAIAALSEALDHLEIGSEALGEAVRTADYDPAELERIEDRLFAIRAAARKFQVPSDDLPAAATDFALQLDSLVSGRERLEELHKRVEEQRGQYLAAARELSSKRGEAASLLAEAVNGELEPLKLEKAEFQVACEVDVDRLSRDGFDRIGFHVRTNPGTDPGPLMKVASGGELSRFLLALKAALAGRGSAPTLVFDEVDTGAGGAVASAIGRRLAGLAERAQVLCVTHAPQVAALADTHYLVTKGSAGTGGAVSTCIDAIGGNRRRDEVARMLAGDKLTQEARAAANRLIGERTDSDRGNQRGAA